MAILIVKSIGIITVFYLMQSMHFVKCCLTFSATRVGSLTAEHVSMLQVLDEETRQPIICELSQHKPAKELEEFMRLILLHQVCLQTY